MKRTWYLLAAAVLGLAGAPTTTADAAPDGATVQGVAGELELTECGGSEQLVVPEDTWSLVVELAAGEGGKGGGLPVGLGNDGGLGGTGRARVPVAPGDLVTVDVGCGGQPGYLPTAPADAGAGGLGVHAGGDGARTDGYDLGVGGGGGGGTELHRDGVPMLSTGGGGGGGEGYSFLYWEAAGGAGAGLVPGAGADGEGACAGAGAGTASAGVGGTGPGGTGAAGLDGAGGDAVPISDDVYMAGGGGGGGHHGGGGAGGGAGVAPDPSCGGGGGGGYAHPDAYDLTSSDGSNEGDGWAVVAWGVPHFVDVAVEHPFFAEVDWMASRRISEGYDEPAGRSFRPSAVVTRQAMSAFLHRLAGAPPLPSPGTASFSDVALSHAFFGEVEWMAAQAISTGYGDGTFRPDAATTRQAMSAFLLRLDQGPGVGI